ncbi:MAG TPA: hypothetical protein ENI86_15870 [Acidimicrobiales bacterium]|nr:hypothetical protein [Acidimicrobiales bacterium]
MSTRVRPLVLPDAAPAPILEPQSAGLVARACRPCEVTWYGSPGDPCWCCGEEGSDGPLRLFIAARR